MSRKTELRAGLHRIGYGLSLRRAARGPKTSGGLQQPSADCCTQLQSVNWLGGARRSAALRVSAWLSQESELRCTLYTSRLIVSPFLKSTTFFGRGLAEFRF